MTALFCSVAGKRVTTARLSIPSTGPWFADLDLDEVVSLSGKVEISFGGLVLKGTVAPNASGSFVLSSKIRVIAGGGGWGSLLKSKFYHNDAGVKTRNVAEDAARESGEALGTFSPASAKFPHDYVRRITQASRVLEDTAGGIPWWVDFDGVTQVRAHQAVAGKIELLEFDPRTKTATVTAESVAAIGIGSTLADDRLGSTQTVHEIEWVMTADSLRATCWCGGSKTSASRAVRALQSIAQRSTDKQILGLWRYRVVSMASDGRANLQAVNKTAGIPDLLPIVQRPGCPGSSGTLTNGTEVLVQFVEGNPSMPVITNYGGQDVNGFVPTRLTLGASSAGEAADAARKGDTVKVLLPPAVFTGTIGGAPATGVLAFPTGTTLGTIETGSAKVGIG